MKPKIVTAVKIKLCKKRNCLGRIGEITKEGFV